MNNEILKQDETEKQWRIDAFIPGKTEKRAFFDSQYDAFRYAIKVAKNEPSADIFMLEKIIDDKYGNITILYKGEEE